MSFFFLYKLLQQKPIHRTAMIAGVTPHCHRLLPPPHHHCRSLPFLPLHHHGLYCRLPALPPPSPPITAATAEYHLYPLPLWVTAATSPLHPCRYFKLPLLPCSPSQLQLMMPIATATPPPTTTTHYPRHYPPSPRLSLITSTTLPHRRRYAQSTPLPSPIANTA